jgi:hypothetical protein
MAYYGNENEGGIRGRCSLGSPCRTLLIMSVAGHFYHVFNTPLYYKWPGMPERKE